MVGKLFTRVYGTDENFGTEGRKAIANILRDMGRSRSSAVCEDIAEKAARGEISEEISAVFDQAHLVIYNNADGRFDPIVTAAYGIPDPA